MNKFILKHGALVTFVILAILAWFFYRQFIVVRSPLLPFVIVTVFVWVIVTIVFITIWPRITYRAYKRAILQYGLGGGPIPVNTIYSAPTLSSPSASTGSLMATGTTDVLYVGGWLDLSEGPRILHVPDFAGRYYSLQFTDPSTGTNFAYVGKRTTGTQAGDYLISGLEWKGQPPTGVKQITSPNKAVLLVGRVFVANESDVAAAYELSKQIELRALNQNRGNYEFTVA